MENRAIPGNHQSVMPYLILKNALKFDDFVQTVFKAKELTKRMRDDYNLMHAEVLIGNSTIMFAECNEQWKPSTAGLFVYVDNADETYSKALENGAISIMAPENKDYGRSCGIKDPFGNVWWITSLL